MLENDFMFDFFVENLSLSKTTEDENYSTCNNYFMFDFFVSTLEPLSKNVGLNIYVSETEPSAKNIAENSIWIKRPNTQSMIYILDKIDTDEDYDNTIVVFTRDGLEEVNLYSGLGFTTLLSIRQVQYSNGELVQILPYWIYRDGEWVSTENTRTQGIKIKIKNKTLLLDRINQFKIANSIESYNSAFDESEVDSLNEICSLDIKEDSQFNLFTISENITI